MERMVGPQIDWGKLKGMGEEKAIAYMNKEWGFVPDDFNDPCFRADVLGVGITSVVIDAHLSNFEAGYGGESRLGSRARAVGDLRNVAGQGMPGEAEWREGLKNG